MFGNTQWRKCVEFVIVDDTVLLLFVIKILKVVKNISVWFFIKACHIIPFQSRYGQAEVFLLSLATAFYLYYM